MAGGGDSFGVVWLGVVILFRGENGLWLCGSGIFLGCGYSSGGGSGVRLILSGRVDFGWWWIS